VALPESFGAEVLAWLEGHAFDLSSAGSGGSIVAASAGAGHTRWGWLEWRDMVLGNEAEPATPYFEVEARGQLQGWPPGDLVLVENLLWAQRWIDQIAQQMEAVAGVQSHPPATEAQRREAQDYCNLAYDISSELSYYAGLCGTWRRIRSRAAAP
jgi:hypothetical protein